MPTEFEFEGQQVAMALKSSATAEAVATALVGCGFYVDDPDAISIIETVHREDLTFILDQSAKMRKLTIQRLAIGYIVEERKNSQLEPLISLATPAHIRDAENARQLLVKMGISHPAISNDDAVKLSEALHEVDLGEHPSFDNRLFIAEIMKRYDLNRAYIKLAHQWVDIAHSKGELLVDVMIQLVSSYRAILDPSSALRLTDFATKPGAAKNISASQMTILFAQRAAALLDLYDREGDKALLQQARACANRSYATQGSYTAQPSDAIRAVYNRLDEAEKHR